MAICSPGERIALEIVSPRNRFPTQTFILVTTYRETKDNYCPDGLSQGNQVIVDELLNKGHSRIFISKDRLKQRIDI